MTSFVLVIFLLWNLVLFRISSFGFRILNCG
jgi:hypothetical protein